MFATKKTKARRRCSTMESWRVAMTLPLSRVPHAHTQRLFFLAPQVILSREQAEGQGAVVRRSIGSSMLRNFDPFLMLDEFDVATTAGFPDHPHRWVGVYCTSVCFLLTVLKTSYVFYLDIDAKDCCAAASKTFLYFIVTSAQRTAALLCRTSCVAVSKALGAIWCSFGRDTCCLVSVSCVLRVGTVVG